MDQLSDILNHIPGLAEVRHFELLNDGRVNEVWKVDTVAGAYVLRRDKPLAGRLGLNRDGEYAVLKAAAAKGFGPQPVWRDATAGLLLAEYLEGSPLTEQAVVRDQTLLAVGKLLRKLHGYKPAVRVVDYAGYVDRYLHAADHPGREQLAAEALELIDLWCSDPSRYVLCHTDPVAANFISAPDGSLKMIDWEYAGLGEPTFDLAVFIRHHCLQGPAVEALCGGTVSADLSERLEGCLEAYDRLLALWLMVCRSTGRLGGGLN
jgi:thiamine kinase-like enzyme